MNRAAVDPVVANREHSKIPSASFSSTTTVSSVDLNEISSPDDAFRMIIFNASTSMFFLAEVGQNFFVFV